MKANTASRTAQYMALFRALETKRPLHNRLFTDPYAIHFLNKKTANHQQVISIANYNFHLLEDSGAAEYRRQYIPERKLLNSGYKFYRVAFAEKITH